MAKGRADVKIDAPAHSKGIRMGNAKGNWLRQPGHLPDGTTTAEKSTGIDAKGRQPIDPRMPNLPPA